MAIDEVAPERLAELFHHYHQALIPATSGAEREWQELSKQEKGRLVAAARLALLELQSMTEAKKSPKPHFAQPGEAEWGC